MKNRSELFASGFFPDEEFLPYSSDYNILYNIRSQDIYFAVRYQSQPPNTIPLHRPPDKSGLYFDEIGLPIVPDEYKHKSQCDSKSQNRNSKIKLIVNQVAYK